MVCKLAEVGGIDVVGDHGEVGLKGEVGNVGKLGWYVGIAYKARLVRSMRNCQSHVRKVFFRYHHSAGSHQSSQC